MKEQDLTAFLDFVVKHYYIKAGSKKLWQGQSISVTTKQVAKMWFEMQSTIVVYIEYTKGHYSAYADNVEGIYGGGDTIAEVKKSIKDAIKLTKQHNKPEHIPAILKKKHTIQFRMTKSLVLNAPEFNKSNDKRRTHSSQRR